MRAARTDPSWFGNMKPLFALAEPKSALMFNAGQRELLLRVLTLAMVCIVSFSIRLFSVLRYESIIHEFDPWFNYRSTRYVVHSLSLSGAILGNVLTFVMLPVFPFFSRVLVEEGSYKFWNWFDSRSWYPLGRIVGGTVYPGIMYTAAFIWNILQGLGFDVHIRDVCVMTAPLFSAFTALSAYALTEEAKDKEAGIVAAAIMSIVPGYISRSVAGSYDNECVAITAMIFCFYLWTKSVKTGSLLWSGLCTLSYLYMVACWGGYIFLINLIPVYVLVMMVTGRYSDRLYVAYNTFYILGSLLSMQIRFVGFNAVQSSEHLGAFGTFGLLNLYCVASWVRNMAGPKVFKACVRWLALMALAIVSAVVVLSVLSGFGGGMTGRIRTLLDPTYATKHIPIIASVSEHQPTAWGSYFFDLHITVYLMPIGLYFCFKKLTDANMFLVTYGTFAVYFSGVMVRLMLVLAPAATMLTAIGISESLKFFMRSLLAPIGDDFLLEQEPISASNERQSTPPRKQGSRSRNAKSKTSSSAAEIPPAPVAKASKKPKKATVPALVAFLMILGLCTLLLQYVRHSIWATSEAYSSPSVVLSARDRNGDRVFFDDYREGYYWLRQNTADDAKIMSWWDYGYQISGMGNRTVIVDNNTWNNTHIATVGKAMNSPEEVSYRIARKLDVDYVLVIFGGYIGYSSDDINKFLWMVRICNSVDPSVKERDYLSSRGGYTVDSSAGPALKKSLMYKLSYYRFGDVASQGGASYGRDRVRQTDITDAKSIKLKYFEEAFTSENWIVRIYRVKKPNARGWA